MIPDFVSTGYVGDLLRPPQQPERLVVRGLRAAHAPVEASHGLDVVVEDLRTSVEHDRERLLLVAEEVRRQHLDRRSGELALQRPDRGRVVAGALVGKVVAIDRGDDDVAELHLRRGVREPQRLERVGRALGLTRVDVAVAAGARARVAEDLEGRRAAAPALGDVRAARLLADRVQALSVEQRAHLEVARVGARRAHLHPLRPAGPFGDGKRTLHRDQSMERG